MLGFKGDIGVLQPNLIARDVLDEIDRKMPHLFRVGSLWMVDEIAGPTGDHPTPAHIRQSESTHSEPYFDYFVL